MSDISRKVHRKNYINDVNKASRTDDQSWSHDESLKREQIPRVRGQRNVHNIKNIYGP